MVPPRVLEGVAAFAEAERTGSASIAIDGVFVDYPILYKAERIIALADTIAAKSGIGKDLSKNEEAANGL